MTTEEPRAWEVLNLDPGSPAYEAARVRLAAILRAIGAEDEANGYTEMADDLMEGDLMQVPTWIALQEMARPTATGGAEEMSREMRLKLDRRIHNQRRALRDNWQIVEQRLSWERAWPRMHRYHAVIARLRQRVVALEEQVVGLPVEPASASGEVER